MTSGLHNLVLDLPGWMDWITVTAASSGGCPCEIVDAWLLAGKLARLQETDTRDQSPSVHLSLVAVFGCLLCRNFVLRSVKAD